jgi:hypothetical protein
MTSPAMMIAIGPMVGAAALPNAPMPATTIGALIAPTLAEAIAAAAIIAVAGLVGRLVARHRPAGPDAVLGTASVGQPA